MWTSHVSELYAPNIYIYIYSKIKALINHNTIWGVYMKTTNMITWEFQKANEKLQRKIKLINKEQNQRIALHNSFVNIWATRTKFSAKSKIKLKSHF